MDIGAVRNPVDFGGDTYVTQISPTAQAVASRPTAQTGVAADNRVTAPNDDTVNNKPIPLRDVVQKTEAINEFLEAMDAAIRFKVHQKTNELIVQVVDQSNNKVLKEFPPHEFLDTMAAIRNYVGILLDKKI